MFSLLLPDALSKQVSQQCCTISCPVLMILSMATNHMKNTFQISESTTAPTQVS